MAELELRANEIKSLAEKRGAAQLQMDGIISEAKAELRALTEEETATLEALESEIRGYDNLIGAETRANALRAAAPKQEEVRTEEKRAEPAQDIPAEEKRAFMNYINAQIGNPVETRAGEQNFTMGNNGAVIPTSIANMIISEIKEISPVFAGVQMFTVKGTLKIPVYGDANTSHNISVAYSDEFKELTADAGKFTSIDLTGYLVGALTLIGKSVINNAEIDIFGYIVSEMAKRISYFLEKELIVGTAGKCTGITSADTAVTAASATAVTADELIELQSAIPTAYQAECCWTMHPKTFTALKKLKDSTGQYLLQQSQNIVNGYPYQILGKPVYLSDNMPLMAAGNTAIVYGDYKGMAVNMRQQIETQVLNEKYATQHAVGLVSWFEIDSKIIDKQKLAALKMAAV